MMTDSIFYAICQYWINGKQLCFCGSQNLLHDGHRKENQSSVLEEPSKKHVAVVGVYSLQTLKKRMAKKSDIKDILYFQRLVEYPDLTTLYDITLQVAVI